MKINESFSNFFSLSGLNSLIIPTVHIESAIDASVQLRSVQRELIKGSKNYIKEVIKDDESPTDIMEDFSYLLDRTIGFVSDEERGKYGRLCAVTVVNELYRGASQKKSKASNFASASHRVLHHGSTLTQIYEDNKKVNPEIISLIFTTIRDNNQEIDIDKYLKQYVDDPFLPILDRETRQDNVNN
jgi:hypothetical protein